jgi:hypothetical protein
VLVLGAVGSVFATMPGRAIRRRGGVGTGIGLRYPPLFFPPSSVAALRSSPDGEGPCWFFTRPLEHRRSSPGSSRQEGLFFVAPRHGWIWGTIYAPQSRREVRKVRLWMLFYVALLVLAVSTLAILLIALCR